MVIESCELGSPDSNDDVFSSDSSDDEQSSSPVPQSPDTCPRWIPESWIPRDPRLIDFVDMSKE